MWEVLSLATSLANKLLPIPYLLLTNSPKMCRQRGGEKIEEIENGYVNYDWLFHFYLLNFYVFFFKLNPIKIVHNHYFSNAKN